MTAHQKQNKQSIRCPVAIIVEGRDYFHFLREQIDGPPEFADVQLFDFSEEGELRDYLRVFATLRGYSALRTIGIIRDREDDGEKTETSVRSAIASCGLTVPPGANQLLAGNPQVAYLLMPHDDAVGCLEHACLAATREHAVLACAEAFLQCIGPNRGTENWKAKVMTRLIIASSPKPPLLLGESAKTGLWDLEHPSLHVMLDFIRLCCAEPR